MMENMKSNAVWYRLGVGLAVFNVLTVGVCFVEGVAYVKDLHDRVETLDGGLSSPQKYDQGSVSGRVRRQASGGGGQELKGRDGRDGRDGLRGAQGPAGPPGPPGPQGVAGPAGQGMTADQFNNVMQKVVEAEKQTGTSPDVVNDTSGKKGKAARECGTSYVRWGRKDCPSGAELVYPGIAGGKNHLHAGGGAQYLCLPDKPQWGNYTDGHQSQSYIYGTEYEILDSNNPFIYTNGQKIHNHDVPCAVCYVGSRGHQRMIPAWNTCPSGWRREYHGYLMSSHYTQKTSSFICVDETPGKDKGGAANHNGALLYNVEAACGSLPCPAYVAGRELTCVVCTK